MRWCKRASLAGSSGGEVVKKHRRLGVVRNNNYYLLLSVWSCHFHRVQLLKESNTYIHRLLFWHTFKNYSPIFIAFTGTHRQNLKPTATFIYKRNWSLFHTSKPGVFWPPSLDKPIILYGMFFLFSNLSKLPVGKKGCLSRDNNVEKQA